MNHDLLQRAHKNLSLDLYRKTVEGNPIVVFHDPPSWPEQQYVLRMKIRNAGGPWFIPPELAWLREHIFRCARLQMAHGLFWDRFVYVTVRCGPVASVTDDIWHVDGFSMRIPHVPEQNYLCVSGPPTEYLNGPWDIPLDFDPLKHHLHRWLDHTGNQFISAGERVVGSVPQNHTVLMDPYVVHRRPKGIEGIHRKMYRISFVPIEIQDDTNHPNPLMPRQYFGTTDYRQRLTSYAISSSNF